MGVDRNPYRIYGGKKITFFLSPLHQSFLLLEEVDGRNVWPQLGEKQENCVEVEKLNCYWDKVTSAPHERLEFTLGVSNMVPALKKKKSQFIIKNSI